MRIEVHAKHNEAGISVKLALLYVFFALFCVAIASSQSTGNMSVNKFKAPLEYCDPPFNLQVRTYLESAQADPQGEGLILLRDAKLETFETNGTPQMTITTPQCTFNMKDQTVNSAGPFKMWTSDNGLLQEGVGFFWQKTNSELTISNSVQTTYRGRMTNSFVP